MEALVAVVLSYGHERRVKAFINQEFHECEPAEDGRERGLSGILFNSFARGPCSERFFGLPRAG